MRRSLAVALALVLALGALVPGAAAQDPGDEPEWFTAGGPHLALTFPSDPVTVVDEDRALASATCGIQTPIPPPSVPPPHPALTGGVGGSCFDVSSYADDAVLTVSVQRAVVSVPENRLHFAAGYDGDDDGCVGCTPADALWKGVGQLAVPVLDDEPALMVFVYGATVETDPSSGGAPLQTALIGTISVEPTDTRDDGCEQDPSIPEDETCGIPLEEPRPHLCVPRCQPLIDTTATT